MQLNQQKSFLCLGSNPVIRMLDMSNSNGGPYGGSSQTASPRGGENPSPPSHLSAIGGGAPPSHSSSSKDISPADSPGSHSPPGLAPLSLRPLHPHHHQLNGSHLASAAHSPLKVEHQAAAANAASTHYSLIGGGGGGGFAASNGGHSSGGPGHGGGGDPFSALGQLSQDLRLTHPHITHWLQQSHHHHSNQPPSPVKHEPMSPRDSSHSGGSDYAPL
jgi:hypothetical protein